MTTTTLTPEEEADRAHRQLFRRKRSYRQRWDPKAYLVFLRRLRLAHDNRLYVDPGDPVTEELRARLGPHKLKVWWEAKILGLRWWDYVKGRMMTAEEIEAVKAGLPPPAPKSVPVMFEGVDPDDEIEDEDLASTPFMVDSHLEDFETGTEDAEE